MRYRDWTISMALGLVLALLAFLGVVMILSGL